jgi:hypothetical protein
MVLMYGALDWYGMFAVHQERQGCRCEAQQISVIDGSLDEPLAAARWALSFAGSNSRYDQPAENRLNEGVVVPWFVRLFISLRIVVAVRTPIDCGAVP